VPAKGDLPTSEDALELDGVREPCRCRGGLSVIELGEDECLARLETGYGTALAPDLPACALPILLWLLDDTEVEGERCGGLLRLDVAEDGARTADLANGKGTDSTPVVIRR